MPSKDTFGWHFVGQSRPDFAIEPKVGQESVWDYPRPPAIRLENRSVRVAANGVGIAYSEKALKLCETASPPTFYIPTADIDIDQLIELPGHTYCEWKGRATYVALKTDPNNRIGWFYPMPKANFEPLQNHLCFYPSRVDCFLNDEAVRPQAGDFYGGWITDDIAGPFKGDAGTHHF